MQDVKLRAGKYMIPAQMWEERDRLFIKFGFNRTLLDEIKAMEGPKWHGYDETNPRKVWSIKKSQRNLFQLDYLMGNNPYKPYDAPLVDYKSNRPLYDHQIEMVRHCLTRHGCVLAAEMGTGKTLVAIEVIEHVGGEWIWCGPKPALRAAHEQFEHWNAKHRPTFYTYEGLVKLMDQWPAGRKAPIGVIFDESSRLKNPTAQRSQAALALAQGIREDHGLNGFVIEMSGSPAPKSPADWWHQCEVACPGFIREGTFMKFKQRMGVIVNREGITGGSYPHLVTWRDDEAKCSTCGEKKEHLTHDINAGLFDASATHHPFVPGVNEVAKLYERMKGLVLVKFKKDCLNLPDKVYLTLKAPPSRSTLNAAKLITAKASTAAQGLVLLRELSDGFQYKEIEIGRVTCGECKEGRVIEKYDPENPETSITQEAINAGRLAEREAECFTCKGSGTIPKYQREAKQIPCPKEDLLRDILEKQEDIGRIVIYAGFTGSVDRCVSICASEKWSTIRVDGRGWSGSADLPAGDQALYHLFQKELTKHPKVAFIGQPGAAGMGLTLTAASTIVFYSNDFNAESRIQAEDRIHRASMDVNRGATIIDLVHLPTDEQVINNLKKKRQLQDMSMGEIERILAETKADDERLF